MLITTYSNFGPGCLGSRDNRQTVLSLFKPKCQKSDTAIIMKTQTHISLRKLLLALAALGSVWLGATGVSAQSSTPDPVASLRSAKLIFVKSSSVLVGTSVIEEKLQQRPEFSQLGLVITRDAAAADLILEVHHDVFTKFVYNAIDPKVNILVASGKLSSLGGTVAGKVAKRFLQQMMKARASKT